VPGAKDAQDSKKKSNRQYFRKCALQAANFGPPPNLSPKFDCFSSSWDPEAFAKASKTASPKLKAMLDNIAELDRNDLRDHGTLFKHFIFSDVDDQGYGARMVIGALLAAGFRNMISTLKRVESSSQRDEPDRKTFAFMNSLPTAIGQAMESRVPVYGSEGPDGAIIFSSPDAKPLMFSGKDKKLALDGETAARMPLKKYVNMAFNDKSNNQGQHIRFIVLSRAFKEGIDLYDVKYAHLFDPLPETGARQAMGRGTRFCGQQNLKFLAGIGWQLHVYKYEMDIPPELAAKYGWDTKHEEMLKAYGDGQETNELLTNSFHSIMACRSINLPLSSLIDQQIEAPA